MASQLRARNSAAALALFSLVACSPDSPLGLEAEGPASARAGFDVPGAHRQYGVPVKMGNGKARTYVILHSKDGNRPLEIGIALDQKALEGLPSSGMPVMTLPAMPAQNPTQFEFAMVDWNPAGHEPPGVYDLPHFDFHFYMVPPEQVMAIDPADPNFVEEANNVPTGDFVPPFYVAAGPSPAAIAVPKMGVHWSDVRSPELQGLFGNPDGFEPFTKTFIYGSWDGRFTFLEPMITREYLLTNPDEVIAIPQPAAYPEPGWYPTGYRISFDAQAKEYRVGLTDLVWRD